MVTMPKVRADLLKFLYNIFGTSRRFFYNLEYTFL